MQPILTAWMVGAGRYVFFAVTRTQFRNYVGVSHILNWQGYNSTQICNCYCNKYYVNPRSTQTCTEMVMPMTCSNNSMFPPSGYDYKDFAEQCMMTYGVRLRIHWITTEFGGKVSHLLFLLS